MKQSKIQEIIRNLYTIVSELEGIFPGRPFTPDGHMVGSIGECLVADKYGLVLMPPSNQGYDAITGDGTKVEIKATLAKCVAFRSCPEHTIIIKIKDDGTFEEIYNGPGSNIWKEFKGKKLPSNGQFQISLHRLRKLNSEVQEDQKINKIA